MLPTGLKLNRCVRDSTTTWPFPLHCTSYIYILSYFVSFEVSTMHFWYVSVLVPTLTKVVSYKLPGVYFRITRESFNSFSSVTDNTSTFFFTTFMDYYKKIFGLRCALVDLTPRLTWEHWIYGNYNAAPYPAEFLWNTRQRLHVNVIVASPSGTQSSHGALSLSYIPNDYFLCKSMNEIRATGTYTCHVPQLYLYTGWSKLINVAIKILNGRSCICIA